MSQRLNSPDSEGACHFVTINVRERKRPFAHADYARLVLETLRFECDRHPAQLLAYVVMPDHLHILLHLADGSLTRFLARYKPNVTRNLDALLQQKDNELARGWLSSKEHRELWQDSKYSLLIYSPKWMREKIDYIHNNPVRAVLREHAAKYEWSSYGAYADDGFAPPVKVDVWSG